MALRYLDCNYLHASYSCLVLDLPTVLHTICWLGWSLCVWQVWCCLRLYVRCWLLGCPDGLWAPCTGLGLHRVDLLSPVGLGKAPLAGLGVALACDAWRRQNSRPQDVSVVSATQEWSESWLPHLASCWQSWVLRGTDSFRQHFLPSHRLIWRKVNCRVKAELRQREGTG